MNFNDFLEYMEGNLSSYPIFMKKAKEYQLLKNKGRSGKAKWSDVRVEKETYNMWLSAMQTLHAQIQIKAGMPTINPEQKWLKFIEENEVIEAVNDGLSEIEFE